MTGVRHGIDGILATRRNHGLEHATVAVLLERFGFTRSLAGRSNEKGFHIFGNVSTEDLRSAVDEGLERMRRGEASLAVSPFCGTNIAITGMLAGLTTLAIVGNSDRMRRLPGVLLGGMVSVILGQPLGRLAQKYLTTSADVSSLRVEKISRQGWGPFKAHWVQISQ